MKNRLKFFIQFAKDARGKFNHDGYWLDLH